VEKQISWNEVWQAEIRKHRERKEQKRLRLIRDLQQNALSGRTNGWHITLNTKAILEDKLDRERVRYECERLERQLDVFTARLNGFCYRRRKQLRLRAIGGIEIGKRTHRLHAHLIVAHGSDVNKTTEQLAKEIVKQWNRVYQFDEDGFVKVEEVSNMESLICYVTKDIEKMERTYQYGSVRPY